MAAIVSFLIAALIVGIVDSFQLQSRNRSWFQLQRLYAENGDGDKVICAKKASIGVPVEAGKVYSWCSCGRSKNQPFCDGSHKGTAFASVKFTAPETKTVFLCQCKQSKNGVFCDGSHKKMPEDAEGKAFPPNFL